MKIRTGLLLIFWGTITPFLLVIGMLVLWIVESQVVEAVRHHHEITSRLASQGIHLFFEHQLDRLALFTSRTQLRLSLKAFLELEDTSHRVRMVRILKDAREGVKDVQAILVYDLKGRLIAVDGDDIGQQGISQSNLFAEARSGKAIIDFHTSENNTSVLMVAGPLVLRDTVIGVLVLHIDADSLGEDLLITEQLGDSSHMHLISLPGDGTLIQLVPERRKWDSSPAILALDEHQPGSLIRFKDNRGVEVFGLFERLDLHDWYVLVTTDYKAAMAPVQRLRLVGFWILLAVIVSFTIMAVFLSRSLSNPINRLRNVAEHILRGDLQAWPDRFYITEFNLFVRTFEHMATKLTEANRDLEQKVQEKTLVLEQTNNELASSLKELKRSNENLTHFAYTASHDLQEPLRKVTSYLELLKEELGDALEKGESRDFIGRCLAAAERMRQMIQALLALSQIRAMRPQMVSLSLAEVLNDALSDTSLLLDDAAAKVLFPQELPRVHGNRALLNQLFQNIIVNAVKYRRQGVDPVITITQQKSETTQMVSFHDNGKGFRPDQAEKIFQPFARLEGRSKISGSGIGLAICKEIIELHGGEIYAEGEPGKGAVFHLIWPLQVTAQDGTKT